MKRVADRAADATGDADYRYVSSHDLRRRFVQRLLIEKQINPQVGGWNSFQATINEAVGLNQEHLWFFGTDEDYWESSVTYMHPDEYEGFPSGGPMGREETAHNAAETSVADMVTQLALDERDRICYLFDYGSEWRLYAILKEIMDDESRETPPEVTKKKGETVVQYPPLDEDPRYR